MINVHRLLTSSSWRYLVLIWKLLCLWLKLQAPLAGRYAPWETAFQLSSLECTRGYCRCSLYSVLLYIACILCLVLLFFRKLFCIYFHFLFNGSWVNKNFQCIWLFLTSSRKEIVICQSCHAVFGPGWCTSVPATNSTPSVQQNPVSSDEIMKYTTGRLYNMGIWSSAVRWDDILHQIPGPDMS